MSVLAFIPDRSESSKTLPLKGGEEAVFPFGLGQKGLHECAEKNYGDMSALTGFVLANIEPKSAILCVKQYKFVQEHGRALPSGVELFKNETSHWMDVVVSKPVDALWAIEEGLKSSALDLVIGEVEDADFTATRRLKLASERYGVPVVLLMPHTREGISACDARWRINSQPSTFNSYDDKAPGSPRWKAVLERCRSAPSRAGEAFDLEYDDEALSLRVAPYVATGSVAPQEISTLEGEAEKIRRNG